MESKQIGDVIREARERRGMSQEELCGLAFATSTLSKIENNHALPSRKIREYICQKLDLLESIFPYEAAKFDYEKALLEVEIKKRIAKSQYDYSDLLEKYKSMMSNDSPLDRQFYMYASTTIFYEETKKFSEAKERDLEALAQTFSGFSIGMDLESHYFSSLEITLMNCIALGTYNEDKRSAMSLMRRLKEYCEKRLSPESRIVNNYPSILFNVQNWEGFAENWEEAYKIADEGLKFCMENGNTFHLPGFFIDKGWNALQLGRKEEAKKCITEAYALLKVRKSFSHIDNSIDHVNELLGKEFAISKEDF